jgi:hypothetical protein
MSTQNQPDQQKQPQKQQAQEDPKDRRQPGQQSGQPGQQDPVRAQFHRRYYLVTLYQ